MIFLIMTSSGIAQMGIGTTTPHSSAMLHVESNTKGFLPPRMTSAERTGILNPKTGLMVFDTITQSCWVYRQGGWTDLMNGGSGWLLTGNSQTTPALNFLGTTDTSTLIFKVNNEKSGMINYTGQLTGFGYHALLLNTGTQNTAIGYEADFAGTTSSYSNATVIGYQAKATAGNQVRLGNNSVSTLYCMGAYAGEVTGSDIRVLHVDETGKIGWYASSSRYKTGITDMEDISWIYRLRPVNFVYKQDPSQSRKYGLIAEEVEKVNPGFVSHNSDGVAETVKYEELIAPIIKTIQEQQAMITRLAEENARLVKRVEDLEKGK